MTLEPADLEDTFRRYHQFHDAITAANRAAQPKQSIWPSVAKLFAMAVPPQAIADAIVGAGTAILKRAAEEDQPQGAQESQEAEPKQPPTPQGRPKEPDDRATVS